MLRCWPLLAILAVIVAFVVAATPDREFHGSCRYYGIYKTFSMKRSTSNDTCTFKIPSFQCGGYCKTETSLTPKVKYSEIHNNGKYEVIAQEECKCCVPKKSKLQRLTIPAGTLPCQENSTLSWDKDVVIDSIGECTCQTCRSSVIVTGQ